MFSLLFKSFGFDVTILCDKNRSLEGLLEGRRLGLHLFLTIFDSHPPPPSFIFLVFMICQSFYADFTIAGKEAKRHLRHFEILGSSPLRDLSQCQIQKEEKELLTHKGILVPSG